MADEAVSSREWAGVQYPSDTLAGLDLGHAAATLAIEASKSDNFDTATWDGSIPEGPGFWKGQNPVGAADRFWKTLIVQSRDARRPPPPPAFESTERARQIDAVKNFPRIPASNSLAIWVQYEVRGAPSFNISYNREISRRVFEEHLGRHAPRRQVRRWGSRSATHELALPRRVKSKRPAAVAADAPRQRNFDSLAAVRPGAVFASQCGRVLLSGGEGCRF